MRRSTRRYVIILPWSGQSCRVLFSGGDSVCLNNMTDQINISQLNIRNIWNMRKRMLPGKENILMVRWSH